MARSLSDQDIAAFRERLCDVAEPLFAELGAEGVTIRQIAGAMGVSPMTPYRYFRDKDAILAAVRARAFDRHADALERAYADNPPSLRPFALRDAYVNFALENPEAYKVMFDVSQPNQDAYPDLVRAGNRSRATMTLQLRELMEAGALPGDPELIAHLYWAAMHGALMLQLSGMLSARYDAMTLIRGTLGALDLGLFGGGGRPQT